MTFRLHNFFRSSTSTRLRTALNLKGLEYEYVAYALRMGDHRSAEYLAINPAGLVPSLELEDGTVMTQSVAIIEWLDEIYPNPPLLPADAAGRARVRSLAYMVACEIHPLNNLRVLDRLRAQFVANEDAVTQWFVHWVTTTFDPLEVMLAGSPQTGRLCHGDAPTLADICLYAQIWNNRRFSIPLETWPTIARIFCELDGLPAFRNAAPTNQPDAG
jgi:maleylpyruvate isomerase